MSPADEASFDTREIAQLAEFLSDLIERARAALRDLDDIDIQAALREVADAGVQPPPGFRADLTRVDRDGLVRSLIDELGDASDALAALHRDVAGEVALQPELLFAADAVVTATGRRAAVRPAFSPEPIEAAQTSLRLLAELDDPREVFEYFGELPPNEHDLICRSWPELVGALAGVPVDTRVRANQQVLATDDRVLAHHASTGMTAILDDADHADHADGADGADGAAAAADHIVVIARSADDAITNVRVELPAMLRGALARGLEVVARTVARQLDVLCAGLLATGTDSLQLRFPSWAARVAALVQASAVPIDESADGTSSSPELPGFGTIVLTLDECAVICERLGLPIGPWPTSVTSLGPTAIRRVVGTVVEVGLCARGLAHRSPLGSSEIGLELMIMFELVCQPDRLERAVIDDRGLTERHEHREIADWCVTLDQVDRDLVRLRWGAHRPLPRHGTETDRWIVERRGSLVTGSYRRESADG